MEILSWIGLALGLFTGVLMLTKKHISLSDRILTGWLFLLGIEFFSSAFDYKWFGFPLMSNAFLLMNPAFYLYVRSQIDPSFRLRWTQLLHILPYLSFEIAAYLIREPLEFGNFLKPTGNFFFRVPFGLASLLSWGGYNLMSLWTVIQHRKIIQDEFSNPVKGRSVGWILFILSLYSVICLGSFILGLISVFGKTGEPFPHYFSLISLLVLIFLLAFYGLRQERILEVFQIPRQESIDISEKRARYKKQNISEARKKEIRLTLIRAFEKEKLFLNPDLNMDILSEKLNIPKHHLTEVLNTEIGYNFFQFVNHYRVEEVKAMLRDPKNLWSIEAIGYECGFSSKSSFFTTFKKITGITPARFRAG